MYSKLDSVFYEYLIWLGWDNEEITGMTGFSQA